MGEEIIMALFEHASDTSKHFVQELIQQSFRQLGPSESLKMLGEWNLLSKALNTPCKLSCLRDRNHRSLILEFLKAEAASYYKSSYFNHAKIDQEYLKYLRQIGPFQFTEVLTIVNKLKLIEKHHRQRMEAKILMDNHIEEKIRNIMEICSSEKRTVNSTLNKFKAIVEFQDKIELIKELGKLLRQSWSREKKFTKIEPLAQEQAKPINLASQNSEPFFQFYKSEYLKESERTGESFFDNSEEFI